jgi:hypothetical protein
LHNIAALKNFKIETKTDNDPYLEPDVMIEQLLSDFPITVVQSRQGGQTSRRIVDKKLLVDQIHQIFSRRRLQVQACPEINVVLLLHKFQFNQFLERHINEIRS